MTYATPQAFRQALEARIRNASFERGQSIKRVRQLVVFDRFLARVFSVLGERATIKGGVALELRLQRARTTRDIDLRVQGSGRELLDTLQKVGQLDCGDFFSFAIIPDPKHPQIAGEGIVYEGQRYRAEARLAGKVYGDRFGVDTGFGDVLTVPIETRQGSDFLAFAGVVATTYRIYPREAHIAEKLHAYTLPRSRENTRVKDLPDIALLATTGAFTSTALYRAIEATFELRKTHPVPSALPAPPASWRSKYEAMANEDGLAWRDLESVATAAGQFLNPPLARVDATWDPQGWIWSPPDWISAPRKP